MARIEYEDGSLKSAMVWGGVALGLFILKCPPLVTILIAAAIGALNGAAILWLLSKMKTRWMDASHWIGLLALVAALFLMNGGEMRLGALQCLALGSACVAVRSAVVGLLKGSVVDGLIRKHARVLAAMDDEGPAAPKIRFDDVHQAHEAFLAALPAGLGGEYRACITDVTLAKHADGTSTPFQSALGGSPVLPSGVAWPMWGEIPLDYLARINLAELPPSDVPRPASGILEFFYGCDSHEQQPWGGQEDLGSCAVVFVPDPEVAIPPSKPEAAGIPPAHVPLRFEIARVMAETEEMNDRFYDHARSLPADAKARLLAVLDAKDEFEPYGHHRVLSPPARVQGDMDGELADAAYVFGLPPETPWVMLLQLDSDKAVNWQWCDDGAIYFWIPAANLAQGRFDRVWVILQSP